MIENCLYVVCLDQSIHNLSDHSVSYKDMLRQMLTGHGSRNNGGNRWFDKTIQVRIILSLFLNALSKLFVRILDINLNYVSISIYIHEKLVASLDGVNGVCLEHTPCEGVVFFTMFQNILNNMEEEDNKINDVPKRL